MNSRPTKSRFSRLVVSAACLLVTAGVLSVRLRAQELRGQQSPLTAWLDLRPAAPGAPPQTSPSWVESLNFIPARKSPAKSAGPAARFENHVGQEVDRSRSIYRIRVLQPEAAVNDLQMRVFYEDHKGSTGPYVSVWNELGTELMRSNPLGAGLGLPSSETLTIPMKGVDYLEVSIPGDGTQVRAVFLSWLTKTRVLQPADFPTTQAVREPFQILASEQRKHNDSSLYGVVTASLQGAEAVALKPITSPEATFEFELEHQPLVAVIRYEVLDATVGAAPVLDVNGRRQGDSELHLPDLADPAYQGEQHEATSQMAFRYTGWLPAQKTIPGDLLKTGLNSLRLSLSEGSDAVAIRALDIQLKYNWEKLDYVLAPARHETK